jgi:hypothetical protein
MNFLRKAVLWWGGVYSSFVAWVVRQAKQSSTWAGLPMLILSIIWPIIEPTVSQYITSIQGTKPLVSMVLQLIGAIVGLALTLWNQAKNKV